MPVTTLSKKYQIVLPREIREQMSLEVGTQVALYPLDENRAVIVKKDADPVQALEGLGKDLWQKLGGADKYIKQERAAWEKK